MQLVWYSAVEIGIGIMQSKIISEPWHSGSNGRMSIAGYLPKNRRRTEGKAKLASWKKSTKSQLGCRQMGYKQNPRDKPPKDKTP